MLYLLSSVLVYSLIMGVQNVYHKGAKFKVAAAADFSGVLLISMMLVSGFFR
ncbi:hypothetical protein Clim_0954 [Chlorobium limicola DSM 245]|uniref:Uncharacterized protein n=1 Tax=Chlorobium limicola (strain DSM 245 / NBRC 103803 / 6330) TaxID=290315 RepID=B3EIT9_CHLL2|nr:hypothetical protein Clim_0954 [Chlorobium limicola DSM 245]